MPCPCPSSPVRNRRTPAAVVGSCLLGLLMLLAAPGAGQAEQLWSVHAFGIKVGELRVTMSEDADQYQGSSVFQTTGVASLFKRIRFDIRAKGQHKDMRWIPDAYSGDIHTGRRQSKTALDFSGLVPKQTAGDDAPAVPISDQALVGAVDPMTMTWLTLGLEREDDPCDFDQTQFDGTRLIAIRFQSREEKAGLIVCRGVYDRLGGYTEKELREITKSPLAITYKKTKTGWQATRLDIHTRHGPATLHRRN